MTSFSIEQGGDLRNEILGVGVLRVDTVSTRFLSDRTVQVGFVFLAEHEHNDVVIRHKVRRTSRGESKERLTDQVNQ